MVNKALLGGVIGFLLGGLVVSTAYTLLADDKPAESTAHTSMAAQADGHDGLPHGLTGDAFDKAFLAEMIVHHEGAVHMGEEAGQAAKHQELKDFAQNIVTTQAKEIEQMKQWQREWGYANY